MICTVGSSPCFCKVPTCEEVIFPIILKQEVGEMYKDVFPMMPVSPVKNPRVKEIWTDSGSLQKGRELLSPISVHERYSSSMAGSAKRLFGEDFPQRKYLRKGS